MSFPRFVFAVAIASFLSCELNAAKKPAAPPPGTLAGRVAAGGAPVPQAVVHVWNEKKKDAGTIHPDDKGEFHFPLPDGTYEVQASAPQFHPAIPVHITVVVHAQRETWVNLELVPGQ
jgi:hypothetical protein